MKYIFLIRWVELNFSENIGTLFCLGLVPAFSYNSVSFNRRFSAPLLTFELIALRFF